MRRPDASLVAGVVGLAAALLQLGPVLGHGYVLLRDLEFVPHLPLTRQVLGVEAVPRAVPSDLVVSLLSHVVPGAVVEDVILVLVVALGAWGAGRLLRPSLIGAGAAAVLYAWNPYLTEHLLLGQWAILLPYAALPWIAAAVIDQRRGVRCAGRRLLLWLALAAAGGASPELVAALVAVPMTAWRGGVARARRTLTTLASLVVLSLPWLLPTLSQPAGALPDRVGSTVFATRPDTHLGSVGSLLTLGGVWNAQAVPPGRGLWLVSLIALAVTAVALWGVIRLRPHWDRGALAGLVTAGAVGFLIALWGVVPGARSVLAWLTAHSQGVDLLRDGERYLAPFVLLVAVGWGRAVQELSMLRRRAVVLTAVPVLLLPAAAWGIDGALVATDWPRDWTSVAAASRQLPPGPVVTLPWSAERSYSWNGYRPLIDPTARWLPRRVVGDTRSFVGTRHTPQEDPLSRRLQPVVDGGGPVVPALRNGGYAGALVQLDQPGAATAERRLAGSRLVLRTSSLALFAVPDPRRVAPLEGPIWLALAGDALSLFVIAWTGISLLVLCRRRRQWR